jgi:hypothetical protein
MFENARLSTRVKKNLSYELKLLLIIIIFKMNDIGPLIDKEL